MNNKYNENTFGDFCEKYEQHSNGDNKNYIIYDTSYICCNSYIINYLLLKRKEKDLQKMMQFYMMYIFFYMFFIFNIFIIFHF